MNKTNFEWAKWIPIAIIAILLMLLYKTFDNFSQITSAITRFLRIISPLLYGILFCYFLYIPMDKFRSFFSRSKLKLFAKRKNFFSVITVLILLILIIAFFVLVIVPILINSITDLFNSIPAYARSLMAYVERLDDETPWASLNISASLNGVFGDAISRFFNIALMEQITRGLVNFIGGIANIILGLILALYILTDLENIVKFFRRLSNVLIKNTKVRNRLHQYLRTSNSVLFTFLASKGLDCLINMVAVTVILLVFNVPYAFLFGLISGIFNFIPYLGSLTAVIFISLITFITGGPAKAIPVLIALTLFQQMDANLIDPKIMKASLKISPILVIISVIAAGAYFGIAGMFLAVPAVTVIKQILIQYIENLEEKN